MQPTVLSAKFSFQTLFFNVLQHVYSRLVHSKVRHFRTSWWLRFHKHGNAGCESCRTDTTLKSHCSDLFKRQNHISARILFQMVNSEMSRSKDPVQVASRKDLFSIIAYLDGKLPDCCEVSARAVVSKNTQKEHFQSSFRAVSEQFQSSFRAVSEQFKSSFIRAVSEQFQNYFRAVSKQFQSSFRAVSEQFQSS